MTEQSKLLLTGAFFAADQALKAAVRHFIGTGHGGGWADFGVYTGTGIFFSGIRPGLVAVASVVVLTFLGLAEIKREKRFSVGFLAVLAGGVSNLVDRVLLGHVIDVFRVFSLQFNLADVLIVVGCGLLFQSLLHSSVLRPQQA